MQSYKTHRDPDIFPDPEGFKPSQWFPENVTQEMNELFMPFSKGTRVCLGVNLASMKLKVTTAALLSRYRVQIAPDMQVDAMEIKGDFAGFPKGECSVIFHPISCQFGDSCICVFKSTRDTPDREGNC
jgi:Cytochrome P450